MFDQRLYQFDKIKSVEAGFGRYYNIPNGDWYPSVTTVLSAFPAQELLDWIDRVGEDEAEKIKNRAAYIGSIVHGLCEQYLLGEPHDPKTFPQYVALFKKIKVHLDQHVGTVYGIECPLYSDQMRVAGRADLVAQWDNIPSIIDFKTSDKIKKYEWISSYMQQMACYAIMFEERTGLKIPQLVVVFSSEDVDSYYYVSTPAEHIEGFLRKRIKYDKIEQQRMVEEQSRRAKKTD